MSLSEQQIQHGFWYYQPLKHFPPDHITSPDQYRGDRKLNIVCTQLDIPQYQQKQLVRVWSKTLPTLKEVRYLWFHSRVNQELFESVCQMSNIEGLYIKWSGIQSLTSLTSMSDLKYLHIGSSAQIARIDVLSQMSQLCVLELENIPKIKELDPLAALTDLEGLAIEGGMYTTQKVDTLQPLSQLSKLRYLFLTSLKTRDATLRPLLSLHSLVHLRTTWRWPDEEFRMLKEGLPNIRFGNPVESRPAMLTDW